LREPLQLPDVRAVAAAGRARCCNCRMRKPLLLPDERAVQAAG